MAMLKFISVACIMSTTVVADMTLYDAYNSLQFRNPATDNVVRAGGDSSTVAHRDQCVLYSEIDNVTSIEKGWDVGSGAGWNLAYPYTKNGSVPPTGIRSSVPLGGMGTGNFELRADGTFRQWCIESQSPGSVQAVIIFGCLFCLLLMVVVCVVGFDGGGGGGLFLFFWIG
jgi:hypothetical protein